jgi:hypothetical protein
VSYAAPFVIYPAPYVSYVTHYMNYAAPYASYAAPYVSYAALYMNYAAPYVSYAAQCTVELLKIAHFPLRLHLGSKNEVNSSLYCLFNIYSETLRQK